MKLICDGLDLSDAVLKVSKALSVKAPNPVLEGIKITAKGDSLTLLATDLELTIEKTIKADVLMEGETVVVGKYFVDFVKKLEKEQVELSRLYDGGLQIKYSDSESELQVFPSENFPKLEKDIKTDVAIIGGLFRILIDSVEILGISDDCVEIIYHFGQREIIKWKDIRNISLMGSWIGAGGGLPHYVIAYPKKEKRLFFVVGEIQNTRKTKRFIEKYYKKKIV